MSLLITDEKSVQVIISLLKKNHIKKVVASPGATNVSFISSIQNDDWFEIYSSVDERSAAYLACGLSHETNEPVVLTCTGATASRNYVSGLTEAFYRKLPILAITSTPSVSNVGHLVPQQIDRNNIQNDIANFSTTLPIVKDSEDLWDCEIKVNKAILALTKNGGGPSHINLPTNYSKGTVKEIGDYTHINYYSTYDKLPDIEKKKVGIFIGSHKKFTKEVQNTIEMFCRKYNGAVFCDHTSNYKGKYKVNFSLVGAQKHLAKSTYSPDLLIHIGEVSGDYYTQSLIPKEVWRVSEDGEIRDKFRKLTKVFHMKEEQFFSALLNSQITRTEDTSYYESCELIASNVRQKIPDLSFSNIWLASQLASDLPSNFVLHLGILNSLRAWNFFEIPNEVYATSTVGGFGIDGCVSHMIGSALGNPNKVFFGVVGDLAFFYDMNALGNRDLPNNIRLMVVNNGNGTEFKNPTHSASRFGSDTDKFISARGHFGMQSRTLLKNYSKDLGVEYFSISNKSELHKIKDILIDEKVNDHPMVIEVFTNSDDESSALESIISILNDKSTLAKNITKNILGNKGVSTMKKLLNK